MDITYLQNGGLIQHNQSIALRSHLQVFILRYEELVSDPASQMDHLGVFLGFPYDKQWLNDFHLSVVPHTEISIALHVPRPIDNRSVGRWREDQHRDRVNTIYDQWGAKIGSADAMNLGIRLKRIPGPVNIPYVVR